MWVVKGGRLGRGRRVTCSVQGFGFLLGGGIDAHGPTSFLNWRTWAGVTLGRLLELKALLFCCRRVS